MCANYRPISLLSRFSKIFETCLYKQIYSFFTIDNLLHKFQFGFKKKMFTEMVVSEVCRDITANIEIEQITCSIFLDLRKAFDTVNHNILLLKLQAYGVRGLPLQLLQSYLTYRSQCTCTIVNHI